MTRSWQRRPPPPLPQKTAAVQHMALKVFLFPRYITCVQSNIILPICIFPPSPGSSFRAYISAHNASEERLFFLLLRHLLLFFAVTCSILDSAAFKATTGDAQAAVCCKVNYDAAVRPPSGDDVDAAQRIYVNIKRRREILLPLINCINR